MGDLDRGGGEVELVVRRVGAELRGEQHEHRPQPLAAGREQVGGGDLRHFVGVAHLLAKHLLDALEPLVKGGAQALLGGAPEELLRETGADDPVRWAAGGGGLGGHVRAPGGVRCGRVVVGVSGRV